MVSSSPITRNSAASEVNRCDADNPSLASSMTRGLEGLKRDFRNNHCKLRASAEEIERIANRPKKKHRNGSPVLMIFYASFVVLIGVLGYCFVSRDHGTLCLAVLIILMGLASIVVIALSFCGGNSKFRKNSLSRLKQKKPVSRKMRSIEDEFAEYLRREEPVVLTEKEIEQYEWLRTHRNG